MRFEWFVARRSLRSPCRPAVLRLATLFSIMGVPAGVATLVIALSMNTGFRKTLGRTGVPRIRTSTRVSCALAAVQIRCYLFMAEKFTNAI